MPRIIWTFLLCLALSLGLAGMGRGEQAPGTLLEDLQYRIRLGVWGDVARVHLRLTRLGPDRYRAQFVGAAQGAWKLFSRWLPEKCETEMVLEGGRLKPLVFKEEFQAKGQRVSKEYRFDYSQGVMEVWRGVDGGELRKSWQVPLQEALYDSLTVFYNLRLGAWGALAGGQSLKVAAIPDPEPREMVIEVGPLTARGRKVMMAMKSKGAETDTAHFFLLCSPRWVPVEVSFRVMSFAKLSGQLMNPDGIMQDLHAALSVGK